MRNPSLLAIAWLAGCGFGGAEPVTNIGVSTGQPDFGATVTRAIPPPPMSGGTLIVLRDGNHAVAADPDRDRIYVVDLEARTKVADVPLPAGSEPGRAIEDGQGRVHVVLRRGGALVTLDPASWSISATRPVCPAPRGVAWDAATDLVHVACAGGELVSLPASGGAAVRSLTLDRDLRDVVVIAGHLFVTRFRSAELLTLDGDGNIVSRDQPAGVQGPDLHSSFTPAAAWRTLATGDGLYMVHQRGRNGVVSTSHGGYGGGGDDSNCDQQLVQTTVTHFVPGQPTVPGSAIFDAVVPLDLAIAHDTNEVAIVAPGNTNIEGKPVVVSAHAVGGGGCEGGIRMTSGSIEPIAVAYTPQDVLIVQSREPARLVFVDTGDKIDLSADSVADTGHAVFHANSGVGIACASCHLEGGDDGRTWSFDISGLRRTQSLRGGISGTAPFHWDGNEADFPTLEHDVFEGRMAGPTLKPDQVVALSSWVDHIPLIAKAPADPAAVARGQALFDDAAGAGCITCHNGPRMTNAAVVDVGTGGKFKVPRLLGIADRAPFLHDGRAATLTDRFSVGGGDSHGKTSQLTAAQIADLVAYLESL